MKAAEMTEEKRKSQYAGGIRRVLRGWSDARFFHEYDRLSPDFCDEFFDEPARLIMLDLTGDVVAAWR